jgi:hypothetical protein
MSTHHLSLVLVALALLVLGAVKVASPLDKASVSNSTDLSGFGSLSPVTLQDGERHASAIAQVDSQGSSERVAQQCVFVDIKGSNGIRATGCVVPLSTQEQQHSPERTVVCL